MSRSAALLLALLFTPSAWAVPAAFTTQGRLLDADGSAVDGSLDLTFRLLDSEAGGSTLWSERQVVAFNNGYYSVVLGADEGGNPLTDAVLDQWPLWLEVQVDGQPPMFPRTSMGSVPYARIAGRAEELIGGRVDAETLAVGGVEVVDASGAWVGAPIAADWSELTGVPAGFADGVDADLVAGLSCADDQTLVYSSASGWTCADPGALMGAIDADLDLLRGEVATLTLTCDANTAAIDTLNGRIAVLESGALILQSSLFTLTGRVAALEALSDADTLSALSCLDGEVAKWDGPLASWICAEDVDTILNEAEVDAMVSDNGYAAAADLLGVEENVALLEGSLSDLSTNLSTFEADMGTVDTRLADLSGRTTTVEGTVTSQQSLLDVLDSTIAAIGLRLTAAEAVISTLAGTAFSGSFLDLSDVPLGLRDGDDDSLGSLSCSAGQIPRRAGAGGWSCGDDQTLTDSEVVAAVEASPAIGLLAGATVGGWAVLTEASSIAEWALDASTASNGDVLMVDGGIASWRAPEETEACVRTVSGAGVVSLTCGGVPVSLAPSTSTVVDLVRGPTAGWALSDGTVRFRSRGSGGWRDMSTQVYPDTPVKVVSTGSLSTALLPDGTVAVRANTFSSMADAAVAEGLLTGSYRDVVAGDSETCALSTAGALKCFSNASPTTLTTRIASGALSVALPLRGTHGCAIVSSGAVQCWGSGTMAAARSGTFRGLSTSEYVTCAVTTAGALQCWGSVSIAPPSTGTYTMVAHQLENQTGCALTTAGAPVCWGSNAAAPPLLSLSDLFAVGAGMCGTRVDTGRPICWGDAGQPDTL